MKTINNVLGLENIKIIQDTDGFKFSLDSVLLANFVTLNKSIKRIMDIGCGNGIISILLSMKTNALIDGVEIQKDSYLNAVDSIKLNHLDDKINIYNEDIVLFTKNNKLLVAYKVYEKDSKKMKPLFLF